MNIWKFDFPLSVVLLNFLSPFFFFNLPQVFFPFCVMQLEAGSLEWPDNLTSSFNLMFYMCFRAGIETESSSWAQL